MEHTFDSVHHVSLRRKTAAGSRLGTLLWVHGLGESGLCFEGMLDHPRLQAWEQYALDLPGYGRSPWSAEPLSLQQHAGLLQRVIAGRLPEAPIVMGHSMGGVIGQLLAETAPQQVRALCNVEGNISAGDCTFSGRAAAMDAAEFSAGGLDRLRQEVYLDGADDPALRTYFASLCLTDPRTFHHNSLELVAISKEETLARRLADLGVPQLYILGSPGGGPKRSQELLREAGLPLQVVRPSGHWPFLDQPERFLDLTLPFLYAAADRLDAPPLPIPASP